MKPLKWNKNEEEMLVKNYANTPNESLSVMVGRTSNACQVRANRLGLHKSHALILELRRMENNGNWKGGDRLRNRDGYRYLATGNTLEAEHRRVMEGSLGRRLFPRELVHHINGNPSDNSIENLSVMTRNEHMRLHRTGKAMSEETKNKLSLSRKGIDPWNKGKVGVQVPWNKGLKNRRAA
jgi:hypothetical protein